MSRWSKVAVSGLLGVALAVSASACVGPPAPDSAVCADLIQRLCRVPSCDEVETTLGVSGDCARTLLANTGCGSDAFRFTTPSRDRVLACRGPLLSEGDGATDVATCSDAEQTLSCQDLAAFLRGENP